MQLLNDKQWSTGRRVIELEANADGNLEIGNVEGWFLDEVEITSGTDDAIYVSVTNKRATILFSDTTTAATTEGYRGHPDNAAAFLDTPITVSVGSLTGNCRVYIKMYQGA